MFSNDCHWVEWLHCNEVGTYPIVIVILKFSNARGFAAVDLYHIWFSSNPICARFKFAHHQRTGLFKASTQVNWMGNF